MTDYKVKAAMEPPPPPEACGVWVTEAHHLDTIQNYEKQIDFLQAERDKLSAEVERLTAWGNERHAAAREAMDTAYHLQYPPSPEMLENIAERIDCGGNCETAWREWDTNATGCTKSETDGCPFEEAANLRDFAKALRVQALAHHSAPVGGHDGDETAWLIEETWSGFVHYVHRDWDCPQWEREGRADGERRKNGWPAKGRMQLITKDVSEAMRFPTKEDAEAWMRLQPKWLGPDQFQVREHMWTAPPTTSTSAPVEDVGTVPAKLGNTPTGDVLATAADMLDEAAQRLGLKIDMPVIARKLRELHTALRPALIQPQGEERSDPLGLAAADDNHKTLVEALLAADHAITGIELARIRGADDGREGVRLAKLVVNLKAAAQNLAAALHSRQDALAPFTKETDHG